MPQDDSQGSKQNNSVQTVEIVGSRDWFLKFNLENVIPRGVEFDVTLTVGGSIISGVLISGKTYFEELAVMMEENSNGAGDLSKTLADLWRPNGAVYAFEKPDDAPEDWSPPSIGYIHLRNARYFLSGQPIPSAPGMLWRGKLSSVDGFSIGSFSAP